MNHEIHERREGHKKIIFKEKIYTIRVNQTYRANFICFDSIIRRFK